MAGGHSCSHANKHRTLLLRTCGRLFAVCTPRKTPCLLDFRGAFGRMNDVGLPRSENGREYASRSMSSAAE